jgi:head-tail adaptor
MQRINDGQGGFTENWISGQTRMAHVERLNYDRHDEGYQQGSNYDYLIKVDSRELDVILPDRIVYDNKILSIQSIENKDEKNRELHIVATDRKT